MPLWVLEQDCCVAKGLAPSGVWRECLGSPKDSSQANSAWSSVVSESVFWIAGLERVLAGWVVATVDCERKWGAAVGVESAIDSCSLWFKAGSESMELPAGGASAPEAMLASCPLPLAEVWPK
jgi:hypothetical protein